jgi:hypothetical protein
MLGKLLTIGLGLVVLGSTVSEALARDHKTTPPNGRRECKVDLGDITSGPPDPGAPGPFLVWNQVYNFGDAAANVPGVNFPVEMRGEVTYPLQLECGPFPIVFIMHGNHRTCIHTQDGDFHHIGDIFTEWPCPAPPAASVLPNYQGYNYLAEILASHGIITVSISANGINAGSATNLDARAELFQRHMELWEDFTTLGAAPFGNLFLGKIDMDRVGTMGHSRGAGGAGRHVKLNAAAAAPFGLKATLLIGGVSDSLPYYEVSDVALGILLPYCDGDQEDLPSVAYFDASRYAVAGDTAPKHSFEVIGANHNYYNVYWDPNIVWFDAVDDWTDDNDAFLEGKFCITDEDGNGRLTSEEQQGTLIAIGSAFFRTYLRKEKAFRPFLRADAPPPRSAKTDGIYVGYMPKDEPEDRLDVNRLAAPDEAVLNTLGGTVDHGGLERFHLCEPYGPDATDGCLTALTGGVFDWGRSPHGSSDEPVTQLRLAWDDLANGDDEAFFSNDLTAGYRDVSGYRALQFRAFVDFTDPLNPFGQPQNLRVRLEDGAGLTQTVVVGNSSDALFFPPSLQDFDVFELAYPRAVFNTVRVQLSAFNGVFLTDIRRISLVFDQTPTGAINVADLAFADEASNQTPLVSCSLAETQLTAGGDKLIDVGLDVAVEDEGAAPIQVAVYSDEDDLDSDVNQSSPDAKDLAPGTLRLRAERDKNADGRVYVIVSKAEDDDGALGHRCCTAIVPLSTKADDVADAEAQASDALGLCTSFAAASEALTAVPPGFFEVGDGPVIGPNQ